MDGKTLFWCLVGMIVGTYLFKEMGVDVIQTIIDSLNSVFTYVRTHASK